MSSEERNENVKSSTKTVAQSSDVEIKSYYFKLQCNVFLDINKIQLKKKKQLYGPFSWIGFICLKARFLWMGFICLKMPHCSKKAMECLLT